MGDSDKLEDVSDYQTAWQNLARAVQEQFSHIVPRMKEMTAQDVKCTVEALRDGYWLTICAATFDKKVEIELNRTVLD